MQSKVVITVPPKPGNLSKATLAVWKLRVKLISCKLVNNRDGNEEIHFVLDSSNRLDDGIADIIRRNMPSALDIRITDGAIETSPSTSRFVNRSSHVAKKTFSEPKGPSLTAAPLPSTSRTPQAVDQIPAFVPASVEPQRSIHALISRETSVLTDAYPDIREPLLALATRYVAERQHKVLLQTGRNLGAYAAREYELNKSTRRINQTVQQSLSLKQAQFGSMPVIADLMSAGVPKKKAKPKKAMEIVVEEMAQFLSLSADGTTLLVDNCPLCDQTCCFIEGFVESFVTGIRKGQATIVSQIESRATGSDVCKFLLQAG